jgi:ribosomal protein L11 methyltransferase
MADEPARWLEASILVDGELAEAVADVLGRYASNGVVVESGITFTNEEDEGTPSGPVRVFGYLAVDENLEARRQALEEALWHLGQIQPLPPLTFKTIVDEDWMAAWKQHYQPIPVGKKLLVLPAWLENPYPDRIAIRIDPSMAFGTGTHPTTQLCLQSLESLVQENEPVIDIGCGSGILSIAALQLGASHALAVDIDSQAVRSTHENAAANHVLERLETGIGSVSEIKNGSFSIRQAPLVLANILAPVIIRLLDGGLANLVSPGGKIILSGILDRQAGEVIADGRAHGLELVAQHQMLDWVALVMQQINK